jgi:hypothetical protein
MTWFWVLVCRFGLYEMRDHTTLRCTVFTGLALSMIECQNVSFFSFLLFVRVSMMWGTQTTPPPIERGWRRSSVPCLGHKFRKT